MDGVIVNLEHLDIQDFLANAETQFLREIKKVLRQENAVKVNTTLEGEYRIVKNDEEVLELKTFNAANEPILRATDVTQWFIDNVQEPLLRKSSEFQEKDSGWTLRSIISLTVNINKYNPMRGSSYIKLPASIQKKHARVIVQNFDDDHCFKWAVFSALHPAERNPGGLSNYQQHENELSFAEIAFPVMPKDVPKFEHQNDISINVYILQNKEERFIVAPIHITGQKRNRHVNLLLIQNEYPDEEEPDVPVENDDKPVRFHYV